MVSSVVSGVLFGAWDGKSGLMEATSVSFFDRLEDSGRMSTSGTSGLVRLLVANTVIISLAGMLLRICCRCDSVSQSFPCGIFKCLQVGTASAKHTAKRCKNPWIQQDAHASG